MSKKIAFVKNRLTYGKTSKIFAHEIHDAVETPFGLIVLFNWRDFPKRNMFLLNDRLEEIWQVEDLNPKMENCPYTGVTFAEGKIKAYNWIGYTCEINPETGRYENAVFTK